MKMFKTKAQMRAETADSVSLFLKTGGSIEVIKAKKAPKQKMSGKTSRSVSGSTSGFAVGYSRCTIG